MDSDFGADASGLHRAVDLLATATHDQPIAELPEAMPERGIGASAALDLLAPLILGGAAPLGATTAFAHMDPPTPWVTWAISLWNAALNQNSAPSGHRARRTKNRGGRDRVARSLFRDAGRPHAPLGRPWQT